MTWLSNVWMSGRRKSLTTKRSLDFRWRHVLEPTLISCTEFSSGPSRCSPSRRACGLGGRVKRRCQQYLFLRLFRYRSEEHTSELQSLAYLVCRLLLEKKNSAINQLAASVEL